MISFNNINVSFNDKVLYKDFSISFEENTINFIMGESGVGKTTLIKFIKNELLAKNKKVSVSYQESRLIPWKNVYQNLELVIKKDYGKEKRKTLINAVLKNMNLLDSEELYPYELSGGMKQRVSIARSIIYNGDIFIMDEPFKGLDIDNKKKIIEFLKNYFIEYKKTVIIVSHDINEVKEFTSNYILLKGNPIIKEIKYI